MGTRSTRLGAKLPRIRKYRPRRPGSRLGRIVRRAVLVLVCFTLGGCAGIASVFYYFSLDLPAIGPLLEGYDPPQTSKIVAADGTVLGEIFRERRTVVAIERIPKVMVDAVIAAEDAEFRAHEGLDYPGMIRAMITNVSERRLAQGASTITQQVARTFFLTREKTFSRKIKEILLTKRIEERLTKDEILYLYLNQINFGHARYGVQEASRYYFDKDIDQIGLAEAALLAGIPKGPAIYEPFGHPDEARDRRAYVIGEMARHRMISASQAELARSAPLGLVKGKQLDVALAPEAVSRALDEISHIVDTETLRHGGYHIETTLDPRLQRAARQAVREGLAAVDARNGRAGPVKVRKRWPAGERVGKQHPQPGRIYVGEVVGYDAQERIELRLGGLRGLVEPESIARYNPKRLAPAKFAPRGAKLRVSLVELAQEGRPLRLRLETGPQAAVVVIEPATGRILALVGGDAVRPGGFDRATEALRQPGSAFKPIVYLEALRSRRYSASTIIDDSPEVQGAWQPKNSSADSFAGPVRLRVALARSLNLPAVKLIRDLGPDRVVELASRLGIRSRLEPVPALALGASAVTPLELASAYATLSAGGEYRQPHMVARLVDPDGIEIPLVGRAKARVVSEAEAYLITSLLRSVVTSGTGRKARALERPVAGKTGTSNKARDAWFVGYTPDVAAAAWVGYDDSRSIGRREYGGRAALPIWLEVMRAAHRKRPPRDFEPPPGLVTALIDPDSGLLAWDEMEGAIEEIYIEGTEPTEQALPPELLSLDQFALEQLAAGTDGGLPEPRAVDAGTE